MMKPDVLTEKYAPSLELGVGEILECARQLIALTNLLCERAADDQWDALKRMVTDRDMLIVRLVDLKERYWVSVRTAENKEAIERAVRAVMNELGTRDRDMMERLQRRKQEAFAALVEAQKQHQITHYVR